MKTALILGASRGLGLGLARELLSRDWQVIGTVRDATARERLHELEREFGARLRIETLEITSLDSIEALHAALDGVTLDLLFANAGIANGPSERIAASTPEQFSAIMLTNAYGPLRAIEALSTRIRPDGTIAAMSSGLGSVANNTFGTWEVYRASKAALNTLMRSLATHPDQARRTIVVMAPGWVRTDMGGPEASLDVETSCRGMVDVLEGRAGRGGVAYVNYKGETLPW